MKKNQQNTKQKSADKLWFFKEKLLPACLACVNMEPVRAASRTISQPYPFNEQPSSHHVR